MAFKYLTNVPLQQAREDYIAALTDQGFAPEARTIKPYTIPARLTESVSANHGRAQYNGAHLIFRDGEWYAQPVRGKSGLITTLAGADGYFCIPRDKEGAAAGEIVSVTLYSID